MTPFGPIPTPSSSVPYPSHPHHYQDHNHNHQYHQQDQNHNHQYHPYTQSAFLQQPHQSPSFQHSFNPQQAAFQQPQHPSHAQQPPHTPQPPQTTSSSYLVAKPSSTTPKQPLNQLRTEHQNAQVIANFMFLLFLVLPVISKRVTQSFRCLHFDAGDDGEQMYLAVDMAIDCQSNQYTFLTLFASIMLLICKL